MKNILILIFTTATLSTAAQNNFIGIKGGVNWTNVSATNFLEDNKFRTGFSGGLTYNHIIKMKFSIGADFQYDQRGFINYIIFTDEVGNPIGRKEPSYFKYDYFAIPIKVGYTTAKKLFAFANIGFCPAMLIKATTEFPQFDNELNLIGYSKYDIKENVSKFDFSGLVEIGGGYKLKDRFNIYSSFSYQKSFKSITNKNYFPNSKVTHYGINLSLGIKYALTKSIIVANK